MASSVTVLLVDEDPEVLDITQTFLEREDDDLDVMTVSNVNDALDRLEADSFDCVVSDYKMPHMDGVTLGQEVQKRDPDIPVFLFTAREGREVEQEIEDAGLTGYVQKGTGVEQYGTLAEKIRDAVS